LEGETFISLHAARLEASLSVEDLWLRYFALGGEEDPIEVDGYLMGLRELSWQQHNVLALALNERFMELSRNHPVPYLRTGGTAS
jgi:hypothetical protein